MSFSASLAVGQTFEDLFQKEAQKHFYYVNKLSVQEQKEKGADFLINNYLYAECKKEVQAAKTGNIYLETQVTYESGNFTLGWIYKLSYPNVVVWQLGDNLFGWEYNFGPSHPLLEHATKSASFTKYFPQSTGLLVPLKYIQHKAHTIQEMLDHIKLHTSYLDSEDW